MDKVTVSFENSTDVDLDVHTRSWNAGTVLNDVYVRNATQEDLA